MSRANLTASGLDIASFVKEDAAAASASAAPAPTAATNVGPGGGGGGFGAVADSGKPVILQYAAYLGMDVAADTDLLWIAQQALVAELPPGWTEHADPMSGDAYFHNAQTGETVWEHPCDSYYRNLCATTAALLCRHRPAPASPVQSPFCLARFALEGSPSSIRPELPGARLGTRR
jgi:hypothetical protein